ncbi:putative virion protein [Tomato fruit blotch virus]|uniref:Virion protein n=1 Tax=Tomato fruit blotch virus TaxID=2762435 RepID=A0A5C1DA20_9VIRU|nr:putative virion protein [Tomato fruit blotch virus]QEL52510.1 putative virion protein [Tomato fruit blotch virus]QTP72391.1 putative virion protein [Tomato fruit blotch virus]USL90425.1 MAG: 20.5 kDa putative virion membrane protein [Tomato fruit blotch virus]USL90435.1 MAG: 20.5 kDa putative virion membrane protein [Tomato fruit blotch virus]WBO25884.1 putative virion protein [Tomato fruit blotch virus]
MKSSRLSPLSYDANVYRTNMLRSRGPKNWYDELVLQIELAFADPSFVFSCIVAAVVYITHVDDPYGGPLGHIFANHSDQPIIKWIVNNFDKFFGLLVMLPICLRIHPKSRHLVIFAVLGVTAILPTLQFHTYCAVAAGMFCYMNISSTIPRLTALGAMLYFVWMNLKTVHPPSVSSDYVVPT